MADTWYVLAQASSSDGLNNAVPAVDDLPAGTIGRVTVEGLPFDLARVFDLAGMEQLVGDRLAPAHSTVIDVYEQDGVGYIDFMVQGSPVLPILIAIAVILVAIGVIAAIVTVWVKGTAAITPVTDMFGSIALIMVMAVMMQMMGALGEVDVGTRVKQAVKGE